jgi:methanogenic corrinoid protein MtbC1
MKQFNMEKLFEDIKSAVIAGKHLEIETLIETAVQYKVNLTDLINNALIAAMDVVGDRFSKSEIFVPKMQNVIKILQTGGMREKVKVMIGGAPVDAEIAEKIGADAYGKDAAEAVNIVRSFTNK